MSDFILVTRSPGLVEIAIQRPERKNAISEAMYTALADAFEAAEHDASVRVILVTGSEEVFTAGNDLGDFVANPPRGTDFPTFRFMRAVMASTKVIVAGVAGLAVGIGTTLLLHCDLVVAGRGARFMMPFVGLGLVPEFASSRLLPELIGRRRAARHLLLGDPIDAETAYACGLISELVDDGAVLAAARDVARRLLEKPPMALARARADRSRCGRAGRDGRTRGGGVRRMPRRPRIRRGGPRLLRETPAQVRACGGVTPFSRTH